MMIVAGVLVFRTPLQRQIRERGIFANDGPDPGLVEQLIEDAVDPRSALLAVWNTGKLVHREVAIRSLARVMRAGQALPPELESLVLTGALDPDVNVRESALDILSQCNHPALVALAAEQLKDMDQQVRLLGLNQLKRATAAEGVPTVIPLLADADPLIITLTLKLLENWTGESFGVKLLEIGLPENQKSGLMEYRAGSYEKARDGAARAKAWWVLHRGEYPQVPLQVPTAAWSMRRPVLPGDFQLRDLGGNRTRLSDFRGKVVLINFWTTWCPACMSEIPDLVALENEHVTNLVILGVSLDCAPDGHGYFGSYASVEDQRNGGGYHDGRETKTVPLKEIREKVARSVKARGINYAILLDERNEVGGQFNGGELPTTVIVDAGGKVRRRFLGARRLAVFEAMVAEASQPTPAAQAVAFGQSAHTP